MRYAIFPIGGIGQRFAKAGYETKKPLIKIFDKTQLEWSILSCIHNYPKARVVIGCREELYLEILEISKNMQEQLQIEILVLNIGTATRGAAHTVKIILDMLNSSTDEFEFLVLDNDVALEISNQSIFENTEVGLVTTFSLNPSHSFVKVDENRNVINIAEKEPISEIGVVGNYFFRSNLTYSIGYTNLPKVNGEEYISEVIQELMRSGKKVGSESATMVVSYGTPEEIENLTPESFAFLGKRK